MRYFFYSCIIFLIYSCGKKTHCKKISVNQSMLDSVQKKSDTSYTKRYRNQEFATAEYYINRKDTTVCQVMKDTAGQIRQIIMAKRQTRLITAEYYANGQLKAYLPLDREGRFEGTGEFYFENGCVKNNGIFRKGFYSGEWKNYDEKSRFVSTDQYDSNGQLVKNIPAN
jgi:antitoxin component YwqK of YwqJK toxin-antitoxin module